MSLVLLLTSRLQVYETCKGLEAAGYAMQKAPDGGSMKGQGPGSTNGTVTEPLHLIFCVTLYFVYYIYLCTMFLHDTEGLAFARDPDGYWVEIIKRGGYDAEATPYFFEKES